MQGCSDTLYTAACADIQNAECLAAEGCDTRLARHGQGQGVVAELVDAVTEGLPEGQISEEQSALNWENLHCREDEVAPDENNTQRDQGLQHADGQDALYLVAWQGSANSEEPDQVIDDRPCILRRGTQLPESWQGVTGLPMVTCKPQQRGTVVALAMQQAHELPQPSGQRLRGVAALQGAEGLAEHRASVQRTSLGRGSAPLL
mmetsp:Transcript_4654/g.11560  ORF Transcript_4654/g.11560 Transcript_4654/m.11560 type:complete len:204 (-) Transcript_4654:105-716(-)